MLSKHLSSTHVRPLSAWATNTCGCIWCSELLSSTVFQTGPFIPPRRTTIWAATYFVSSLVQNAADQGSWQRSTRSALCTCRCRTTLWLRFRARNCRARRQASGCHRWHARLVFGRLWQQTTICRSRCCEGVPGRERSHGHARRCRSGGFPLRSGDSCGTFYQLPQTKLRKPMRLRLVRCLRGPRLWPALPGHLCEFVSPCDVAPLDAHCR